MPINWVTIWKSSVQWTSKDICVCGWKLVVGTQKALYLKFHVLRPLRKLFYFEISIGWGIHVIKWCSFVAVQSEWCKLVDNYTMQFNMLLLVDANLHCCKSGCVHIVNFCIASRKGRRLDYFNCINSGWFVDRQSSATQCNLMSFWFDFLFYLFWCCYTYSEFKSW